MVAIDMNTMIVLLIAISLHSVTFIFQSLQTCFIVGMNFGEDKRLLNYSK